MVRFVTVVKKLKDKNVLKKLHSLKKYLRQNSNFQNYLLLYNLLC